MLSGGDQCDSLVPSLMGGGGVGSARRTEGGKERPTRSFMQRGSYRPGKLVRLEGKKLWALVYVLPGLPLGHP